jgi:hypothetical protein
VGIQLLYRDNVWVVLVEDGCDVPLQSRKALRKGFAVIESTCSGVQDGGLLETIPKYRVTGCPQAGINPTDHRVHTVLAFPSSGAGAASVS